MTVNEAHAFLPLLLTLCCSAAAVSQVPFLGNLKSYVSTVVDQLPRATNGGSYQQPAPNQLSSWSTMMEYLVQGDLYSADTSAASLGYRVVIFTDTTSIPHSIYHLLEKLSSSPNHWGTFVFNPSPLRNNVIIQCPHPVYDSNTGKQGIHVFIRTGAYAYFVAGTHRCNNLTPTPCSGTTTACTGTDAPYPISDQAHVTDATFQKTTEVIAAHNPAAVFIQLHGFAQGTGDPNLIMSNGTRRTPSPDYIVTLRDQLLLQDATLTFKIVHIDATWTKLTAFTNTQGRFLNGSPNPCAISAVNTSGRFIHIEQSLTKLRNSEQNWDKMANAIIGAFPLTTAFDATEAAQTPAAITLFQNYPNPFNANSDIRYQISEFGHIRLAVYDMLGREVALLVNEEKEPGSYTVTFDTRVFGGRGSNLASGVYLYRLTAGGHVESRKMVLLR
jgi:hypothetical protein